MNDACCRPCVNNVSIIMYICVNVSMCLTKKKVEYFERKFPFFVFCGIWFQVLSIKNVGINVLLFKTFVPCLLDGSLGLIFLKKTGSALSNDMTI